MSSMQQSYNPTQLMSSQQVSTETISDLKATMIGKGGATSSLARPKQKKKQQGPGKTGAFEKHPNNKQTQFMRFYERGDLPLQVAFEGAKRKVQWKVDFQKLDYHHYLPIFFDGIRETKEPHKFMAYEGCIDLIAKGNDRILPVIPQLIIPIKTALNTRDHTIVADMLKILQKLVTASPMIGEALVPYYRQILPVFCLFKNLNKNLGDGIDYGQRHRACLGDLIEQTLGMFEENGGEDAFINIKYMIPTYESKVIQS